LITEGKGYEVHWSKAIHLPPESFIVFDQGFTDYTWYAPLMVQKLFFVAHVKQNALIGVYKRRTGLKATAIHKDCAIQLGDIA